MFWLEMCVRVFGSKAIDRMTIFAETIAPSERYHFNCMEYMRTDIENKLSACLN